MKMYFDKTNNGNYEEITLEELQAIVNGCFCGSSWGIETVEIDKIENGNIYFVKTEYEC